MREKINGIFYMIAVIASACIGAVLILAVGFCIGSCLERLF